MSCGKSLRVVFLLKDAYIWSSFMSVCMCFCVRLCSIQIHIPVSSLPHPRVNIYWIKQVSRNLRVTKTSQILSKSEFLRWNEERGYVSDPNERPHGRNMLCEPFLDWASNNPMVQWCYKYFSSKKSCQPQLAHWWTCLSLYRTQICGKIDFIDSAVQRIATFSLEFLFTPGLSLYSSGLVMWREH